MIPVLIVGLIHSYDGFCILLHSTHSLIRFRWATRLKRIFSEEKGREREEEKKKKRERERERERDTWA